jgi:nitroreductase
MNETIRLRKSIRKYDPTKLDEATLDTVRERIKNVKPIYPEIRYTIEIADKTKKGFGVKAPHFLVFRSEEKDGANENIGFIGQQMDLFFSETGLGSCWVGMAKPENEEAATLPFVICMAFGKATEPLHRQLSEFKRKPLSAISEGTDERLEAARLAPSGINAQNWYFIAENGMIHYYIKKPNPIIGFMTNKLSRIDLGIALCHIASESDDFKFIKETAAPIRKGCVYAGTVVKGNVQ